MKLRPVSALVVQNKEHILLVKKPREKNAWQVPQGGQDVGESAVEAALRELHEECGPLKVRLTSNESIGEYSYEFPENFKHKRAPYEGARVQFFHSHLTGGVVKIDKNEIVDFAWVLIEDIEDYCEQPYADMVKNWLV